jgi:site-specific recombinase XerD
VFPQTEIDGFRRYWRRRKPHSSTAIHYASDVTIFFDWVGEVAPLAITVHHIDQFIDWQRGLGWKPSTIRRRVIALRMFFDYLAYALDRDLANPVQPRRHYVANGDSLPRDLTDEVLQQLFAAIGDHRRDRAIFTLMLHAGLRVGEVVNLEVADVFLKAERPSQLRVQGKGQRERLVYLSATMTRLLQDYLTSRTTSAESHVFLNQHGQPITVTGIQLQLAKYCQQAGIWVTCHQLRHTFASRMIAASVPVTSVQKLLGHRSLRTTQRYIQVHDLQVERDYRAGMDKIIGAQATPGGPG